MNANQTQSPKRPKRPEWKWKFLLTALALVLLTGVVISLKGESVTTSYFLAVASFSIAFAVHYFAVSVGLNGALLRIKDLNTREQLGMIEYHIVTSGMTVLAGGLLILLAAGVRFLDPMYISLGIYLLGAALLFNAVRHYVKKQRQWPYEAQRVLYPEQYKNEDCPTKE